MNLHNDEIEDDGEIMNEDNNEENEEKRANNANILDSKLNTKSVVSSYFAIKVGEDGVPLCDEIDNIMSIYRLCERLFWKNVLTQPTYVTGPTKIDHVSANYT